MSLYAARWNRLRPISPKRWTSSAASCVAICLAVSRSWDNPATNWFLSRLLARYSSRWPAIFCLFRWQQEKLAYWRNFRCCPEHVPALLSIHRHTHALFSNGLTRN